MEDGEERCQEAADYRLQAGREAFSLLGGSDGGSVEAWKAPSMTKDERTEGLRTKGLRTLATRNAARTTRPTEAWGLGVR